MAAASSLRENEWVLQGVWIQDGSGWIQHGRIQDGCHHQVELEWMSLSQIELVWVREKTKMAESNMMEFKLAEFKMAAIIKLGENEWVWVRLN